MQGSSGEQVHVCIFSVFFCVCIMHLLCLNYCKIPQGAHRSHVWNFRIDYLVFLTPAFLRIMLYKRSWKAETREKEIQDRNIMPTWLLLVCHSI